MFTFVKTCTGYDPSALRGTNTGVFIGSSFSEAAEAWACAIDKTTGYEMTGCCRAMFANRISNCLDLKGTAANNTCLHCVMLVSI